MTLHRPTSVLDFLTLAYRPDLHVLVGRWQRPVSCPEFRAGYRATLALAEAVGCPFWQVDLRGRNAPEPATRQWLVDAFLPRVARRLAAPVCLGYLLTPQLLRELLPVEEGNCQVAFFAEEGALTAWLAGCQHRGVAALRQAGFVGPAAAARG